MVRNRRQLWGSNAFGDALFLCCCCCSTVSTRTVLSARYVFTRWLGKGRKRGNRESAVIFYRVWDPLRDIHLLHSAVGTRTVLSMRCCRRKYPYLLLMRVANAFFSSPTITSSFQMGLRFNASNMSAPFRLTHTLISLAGREILQPKRKSLPNEARFRL